VFCQYPNIPFPQNPLFQYSNIPIVPARHLPVRALQWQAGESEAN
jgi:hypothetical protein